MSIPGVPEDTLRRLCAATPAALGVEALEKGLQQTIGEGLQRVLTREGWYRPGGVVDAQLRPVSDDLAAWAEAQSGGDVESLLVRYQDAGLLVTRLSGRTHYFTQPVGTAPESFVQVEVEEIQAVVDRPLVMDDWYPEDLAEFIDPVDYPRLEPRPVSSARYHLRRAIPIPEVLERMDPDSRGARHLRRFFDDWRHSSAGQHAEFCRHWVLAITEYEDSDHQARTTARPLSTFMGSRSRLPVAEGLRGAALANAIHQYDHELGYPFAWFFHLLRYGGDNTALALAVLRDQMGAYDYLPARDLKVLRDWEARPYSV